MALAQEELTQVRADEPSASGDQKFHAMLPSYCSSSRAGRPERADEVAVPLGQDRPFEAPDGGPIRGKRQTGGALPGSPPQHGLNRRLVVEILAPASAGGFENSPDFSPAARKRQNRPSHGQILEELAREADVVGHGQQQVIGLRHMFQSLFLSHETQDLDLALPILQDFPQIFGDAADEARLETRPDLLRQSVQGIQVVLWGGGLVYRAHVRHDHLVIGAAAGRKWADYFGI